MEPFSQTLTIDVRRLRVLRMLHAKGTVAAAADALCLTPSAVSQQLAALSREFGVPLLEPQGRTVRLTAQARMLLDHAAAIERELEKARAGLAAFAGGITGPVSLGAFATAITGLLAPALPRLRLTHPGITARIVECEAPECFARLDAGELDIAVSVDHREGPGRLDPRYRRTDLTVDPFLAAVPEGHPLAGRNAVELTDLADQPWIAGAVPGPCQQLALAACIPAGFNPTVRHFTGDWFAAFALISAGEGVTLVPRMAAANGVPQGVVLRPLSGPHRPARHIFAACRAGAKDHPLLPPVLAALRAVAAGEP
jgi:DNA-binding transcriptional LysR family regulator